MYNAIFQLHTKAKMEPPEDFLFVDENEYKHIVDTGLRGGYFWMTSNRLRMLDVFRSIEAPDSGFRLLSSGAHSNDSNKTWVLSAIRHRWPNNIYNGAIFVLAPTAIKSSLTSYLADLTKFFLPEGLDCHDEMIWSLILDLKPILYLESKYCGITLITGDIKWFKRMTNKSFIHAVEAKERTRIRNAKYDFWTQIGPECGPEHCAISGCNRLRVRLAIHCIKHQYEWIEGSGLKGFEHFKDR